MKRYAIFKENLYDESLGLVYKQGEEYEIINEDDQFYYILCKYDYDEMFSKDDNKILKIIVKE